MRFWQSTLAIKLLVCVLITGSYAPVALAYGAVEYRREPIIGFGNKTGYRDDVIDERTFEVSVQGNNISSQVHMMSIALARMAELANERGHSHFALTDVEGRMVCNQARTIGRPRLEVVGQAGALDRFSEEARVFSVEKVLATVLPAVRKSEVSGEDSRSISRKNARLCTPNFVGDGVWPWHLFNIMEGQETAANSPVSVDETLTVEMESASRFKMQAATTGFTQTVRLAKLALLEAAELARDGGFAYLGFEDLAVSTPCTVKGVETKMQIVLIATNDLSEIPEDRVAMSVEKIDTIMRPSVEQNMPSDEARREMYLQNARGCRTIGSMRTWGAPWTAYDIIARPLP